MHRAGLTLLVNRDEGWNMTTWNLSAEPKAEGEVRQTIRTAY